MKIEFSHSKFVLAPKFVDKDSMEDNMAFEHKSVLLDEVIENMNIDSSGTYVDGTIGGGGHSYEIAKRLTTGALIGLDQEEFRLPSLSVYL